MALTVKRIAKLIEAGRYSDGGNLFLQVTKTGGTSWLFRYQVRGRERALGLALQLPFMEISESMGNHDSKIVGADSVD